MTLLFALVIVAVVAVAIVSVTGGGAGRGQELTRERMARRAARGGLGAGAPVERPEAAA